MKIQLYLSQFPELKMLYEAGRYDFMTRGLVHHNWNHVLRDLARGVLIGERERADMKIVLAGILLHDLGRLYPELGGDHYVVGARLAPNYLKKASFSRREIPAVLHCIRSHGPRGREAPKTLEAKVCYDVDVLSCSVGYLGVARVFDFFMREERMNVKQMVALPSGREGPRKDFYTETGRTLGKRGLQKAREFWRAMAKEFARDEQTVRKLIPNYKAD